MWKIRTRKFLAVLALLTLGLWLTSSAYVVWRYTRRGRPPFPEPAPHVAFAALEDQRLETADRQQIGAWLIRGDRRKGCVLLLHGYDGSRRDMLRVMQWLSEKQFTSLAITLRAHGDSTGQGNDMGFSARQDVVAAVKFLQREFPQRPVYIVGRSMGAAAAIFAAADLGESVAGYFLEQPYKDLRSAVWSRLQNHLVPGLDCVGYIGLRLWAPMFLSVSLDDISPYQRVADIPGSVPIVFITGPADRHARLADVTAVFSQVKSHATLVVFEGAAHVALDQADAELYRTTLFQLLREQR